MENREGARYCKSCRSPLSESYVQVSQAQQSSPEPAFQPPPASGSPPASGKRKTPLIIGGVAGVIVLCCVALIVVGGVLYALGVFDALFAPQQATARIMPADTGLYSVIDPSAANSEGFQHLSEIYSDVLDDAGVNDQIDNAEDEFGISFEKDVQPWLGSEMSLAIPNLEDASGGEPIVVLAAVTRDRKASDAFLEKLKESLEDKDYDVEEETYNGVTFYVQQVNNDWETPLVFGTVDNVVVLTTDVDAMKDIIDTQQGKGDSLVKNERYTELKKALPKNAFVTMFIDVQDLVPAMEDSSSVGLSTGLFGLPAGLSGDQIEAYETAGLAITLDKEGVQIDMAVTFDPGKLDTETLEAMKAQAKANPGQILREIPSDAIGFVSSRDLAASWKTALASIKKDSDAEEQFDSLSESMGIDLDEGFLAWATGEYALAVVEAGGDFEVGFFAIFEVGDQTAAEGTLGDVAGAIEDQGMEFEKETVGGVEMQVLVDPYTEEIVFGYGFAEKHLVIGYTEDGLEQGVGDVDPITNDETFKAVQAHLPRQNAGYFYLNVESLIDLTKDGLDEDTLAFVEPIKAIGGASAVSNPDSGVGQATLFIYIP